MLTCDLCETPMSPRRAVLLDGHSFCTPCRDRHLDDLNVLTDAADFDEDRLELVPVAGAQQTTESTHLVPAFRESLDDCGEDELTAGALGTAS